MAQITGKNITAKALQAHMAQAKKQSARSLLEWEIACNTNSKRGKVYNQEELLKLYSAKYGDSEGATKVCHLHNHNGDKFKHIVIKRFKHHGHIFYGEGTGNQLIDEVNCWLEYAETPEADYLCPILKYFTSKSDKVEATSKTMLHNVLIIAQRAVYVSNCKNACEKAEELNKAEGYKGTPASDREDQLLRFASKNHWRDVKHNRGNSGVIFDYSQNCYKAVFIDYAL